WLFYMVRGKVQPTHELAEQLMRLAQSAQEPALLLQSSYVLGVTLCCQGKIAPAPEQLEQGLALYDPQQHRTLGSPHRGYDPGVASFSWVAMALWLLGYPDQARQRSQEALALARELSHPNSLAWALYFMTWVQQYCRDGHAVQAQVEALMALSREQGFVFFPGPGTIWQGWALAEQGQGEEGAAQI